MSARTVTELPLRIVAAVAKIEPGQIGISVLAWSCLRASWSLAWLVGLLVASGALLFLVLKQVGSEPGPAATVGYAFGIVGGYVAGFFRPHQAVSTQTVNFMSWYAGNKAAEANKKEILDIAAAARMGDLRRAVARFQRAIKGN